MIIYGNLDSIEIIISRYFCVHEYDMDEDEKDKNSGRWHGNYLRIFNVL
jgi:hypothetical protein